VLHLLPECRDAACPRLIRTKLRTAQVVLGPSRSLSAVRSPGCEWLAGPLIGPFEQELGSRGRVGPLVLTRPSQRQLLDACNGVGQVPIPIQSSREQGDLTTDRFGGFDQRRNGSCQQLMISSQCWISS